MFKFLKPKALKSHRHTNTDGLRDSLDSVVGSLDQMSLAGLADSRYPSDSMTQAYNRKAWRESCHSSTVDLSSCHDTVSLRTISKRTSIASSSESISSASSEENVVRLKNGFQVVFTPNPKKKRVEVRVYRDGRLLKRQEVIYHLSMAKNTGETVGGMGCTIDQKLQRRRTGDSVVIDSGKLTGVCGASSVQPGLDPLHHPIHPDLAMTNHIGKI
ncbi:hypothetical protein K493DRAFT_362145 [Basidiobolus meristosporus CBS 931.73]|uniref:Uncharacterized protein n=1 Tax=Basidiobolus meristosporus CBS 931.73 TaxID=1314790 RepID=A0A1Y1X5Q8_9FUNG|nr:hypothetical protein K493DRAFT_362145 [Basidiobolus meristosporus CBS 931.73]|eukprot:ORX80634.1 hypothetical protein K493DRAFT_362145 [Basidiobolus meristosporus CBS 931.73]